jgi:hypothetical protein
VRYRLGWLTGPPLRVVWVLKGGIGVPERIGSMSFPRSVLTHFDNRRYPSRNPRRRVHRPVLPYRVAYPTLEPWHHLATGGFHGTWSTQPSPSSSSPSLHLPLPNPSGSSAPTPRPSRSDSVHETFVGSIAHMGQGRTCIVLWVACTMGRRTRWPRRIWISCYRRRSRIR